MLVKVSSLNTKRVLYIYEYIDAKVNACENFLDEHQTSTIYLSVH